MNMMNKNAVQNIELQSHVNCAIRWYVNHMTVQMVLGHVINTIT